MEYSLLLFLISPIKIVKTLWISSFSLPLQPQRSRTKEGPFSLSLSHSPTKGHTLESVFAPKIFSFPLFLFHLSLSLSPYEMKNKSHSSHSSPSLTTTNKNNALCSLQPSATSSLCSLLTTHHSLNSQTTLHTTFSGREKTGSERIL